VLSLNISAPTRSIHYRWLTGLRKSAIVRNAANQTSNCKFAVTADQTFMSNRLYSFWVNNTQLRSLAIGAARKQIFLVNFTFDEGTPVLNYNAIILDFRS
jgi:hypothetical protein